MHKICNSHSERSYVGNFLKILSDEAFKDENETTALMLQLTVSRVCVYNLRLFKSSLEAQGQTGDTVAQSGVDCMVCREQL